MNDEVEGRSSSEEISLSDDSDECMAVAPKRAAPKTQTVQPKFYQLKRGATYKPPNSAQPNPFRTNKKYAYTYVCLCIHKH